MPLYRLPIPTTVDPTDEDAAAALKDHLATQGITANVAVYNPPGAVGVVQRGAIRAGAGSFFQPASGPPALVIDSPTDPSAALATYTGTPSNGRKRLRQARNTAFAFRDKVELNPSLFTENDKATAAAITLIEALAKGWIDR